MHHGVMCDLAPAPAGCFSQMPVLGSQVYAHGQLLQVLPSKARTLGCSHNFMKFKRESILFPKSGGAATD